MIEPNSKAIPARIRTGLLLAWTTWSISLAINLYLELRPVIEAVSAAQPDGISHAGVIAGILLAIPVLMLTPKFIGSLLFPVMLVLVARRKAWSRWVLLACLVASGVAVAVSFRLALIQVATQSDVWRVVSGGLLYLASALAVAQFFGAQASAWFKSKPAQYDTL